MVNLYSDKTINKIREELKKKNLTKDIPLEDFRIALMIAIGVGANKSINKWISNYEQAKIITMVYKDKNQWIINFNE